jgi:uncharacterized protein YeaO (DUF488 family)
VLKQASVGQLRRGEITKKDGYIAVVMCHYPRGLPTGARDAFHSELAPDRPLFAEWKEIEREQGHARAFIRTRYQHRFVLSGWGFHLLHELAERAKEEQVFLVCECAVGERCHREMLMLIAKTTFGAAVDKIFNNYPIWQKRLKRLHWPIPESALATGIRKFPG